MKTAASGVVAVAEASPPERFHDPAKGNATWATLFSSDVTATSVMSAGVMVLAAGGGHLAPHRHAQPEIYFVAAGSGVLTTEGTETVISTGAAAFIPGNAEHSLRNDGEVELRVFYVFPTDRFSDVIYRFTKD